MKKELQCQAGDVIEHVFGFPLYVRRVYSRHETGFEHKEHKCGDIVGDDREWDFMGIQCVKKNGDEFTIMNLDEIKNNLNK